MKIQTLLYNNTEKPRVIMVPALLSLAAPEVVITNDAINVDKDGIMNLSFQWVCPIEYACGFVVLCFVLLTDRGWDKMATFYYWFDMNTLPIFFRASLALGQSYDCPSANEVTLKNMDKLTGTKQQQNTAKCKTVWCIIQFNSPFSP